jgi:hypothetical protein
VDDLGHRLVDAIENLQEVADEVTTDEAASTFDDATLQVFWRDWPNVSSWAGALWRRLNEDLAQPSSAPQEPDLDEVGGEGG